MKSGSIPPAGGGSHEKKGSAVITALVADLSQNPIVRAHPILRVLSRRYEIQVIGPVGPEGVFPPYRNFWEYETFSQVPLPAMLGEMASAADRIRGDAVFAFKPRLESFGLGLFHSLRRRVPLVLDIEDWEMSHAISEFRRLPFGSFLKRYALRGWKCPLDPKYLLALDMAARFRFPKFVVSDFLMRRFGGTKLYHGPDTAAFDPALFSRTSARESLNLPDDKKIILFAGTPRPHKGLDDLVAALHLAGDGGTVLLTVGADPFPSLPRALEEKARGLIVSLPPLPHHEMPLVLAAADLVVLPQKVDPIAMAQVPAKVFEAMAMEKPIIATAISDLPSILNGCGIIARPGDISSIARGIVEILSSPATASSMGRAARARCVQRYGHDAMADVLFPVFKGLGSKF